MQRNFLKEHHFDSYLDLIMEGQCWKHLAENNKLCNVRMEVMIDVMNKQKGVNPAYKRDAA